MFRKYDNEIRIINVDALTYAGNLENLKEIENRDNYTFVKADITDKEAMGAAEYCASHMRQLLTPLIFSLSSNHVFDA